MDRKTSGSSVLHCLLESAQTHAHWVGYAICHLILSCPLLLLSSVFPKIRVFPMSQLFASGEQSIRALASASVLSMNIQGWFPLGLTDLIYLQYKGLSRVLSNTTVWKLQFLGAQPFLWPNSHICTWTTGKTIALTIWTFVSKAMSLLFNMLSVFVITFLPRSKRFLISWLRSPITVILEPKKTRSVMLLLSPLLFVMKWRHQILWFSFSFFNIDFQASFFTSLSTSSRGSLVPLYFLPLEWYYLHTWYLFTLRWFLLWVQSQLLGCDFFHMTFIYSNSIRCLN